MCDYFVFYRRFHIKEVRFIWGRVITFENKKVLLSDRKKHTAHDIACPGGSPGAISGPIQGYPCLVLVLWGYSPCPVLVLSVMGAPGLVLSNRGNPGSVPTFPIQDQGQDQRYDHRQDQARGPLDRTRDQDQKQGQGTSRHGPETVPGDQPSGQTNKLKIFPSHRCYFVNTRSIKDIFRRDYG